MKNNIILILTVLVLIGINYNEANAQCAEGPSIGTFDDCAAADANGDVPFTIQYGQYACFNTVPGETYVLSTCTVNGDDTQITVWDGDPGAGGTQVDFNDDSCGLQSEVTYVATSTLTCYQVNLFNCLADDGATGGAMNINCPVAAPEVTCAQTCADVAANDCGTDVTYTDAAAQTAAGGSNPVYGGSSSGNAPLGWGGDGSGTGCQSYGDIDTFTGGLPTDGGQVYTHCTEWTATLPDAAFPTFYGSVGATGGCFGTSTVTVYDAATCTDVTGTAGVTVTQPDQVGGFAGQVEGLAIGTTYILCQTSDWGSPVDAMGAPCTPTAGDVLIDFCSNIIEFGTPPLECPDLTAPAAANFCDPGGGAAAPLDLAACTGADGPVGMGVVFDVYLYTPGGFVDEAPAGYENTPIPPVAEFPDPFQDGNLTAIAVDQTCADVIGAINLLNPGCEPAVFSFIYFPFDYTLDTDGNMVAEYPQDCQPVRVDYTIYPILAAVVISDDSATCGDVVIGLAGTPFDDDGDPATPDVQVLCNSETVSCVANGDATSVTFDMVDSDGMGTLVPIVDNPDGACANVLTAAGEACAGCTDPVCPVDLTPPAAANFCDPGGGAAAPLDLAACTGADGPVGMGFVFDVYLYTPGGFVDEAPAGYENTPIPMTAEFPDPFQDGNLTAIAVDQTCADVIGAINLLNPGCEPAVFSFIYFPFDYTLDTDGNMVAEYPQDCQPVRVDYTIYPTLAAVVISDDSATCGDVVIGLAGTPFDDDGDPATPDVQVLCNSETVSCMADGDATSVTFDMVDIDGMGTLAPIVDNPDGACANVLTAEGGTCAGCDDPTCPVMLTPPTAANFCDPGGGAAAPLDLAACAGADGPVGMGFVFDVYIYTPGGLIDEAPAGYENTTIPAAAEFPDPFGDGNLTAVSVDQTCADALGTIGLLNPGCEPAVFSFIYFPFDYTLDSDGDMVAEYPTDCTPVRVDYTIYPTLTALVDTDDSATCGDVTFALVSTPFDNDGDPATPDVQVLCNTATVSCAPLGNGAATSVTFDMVDTDGMGTLGPIVENPDGGCNTLTADGGACAGCVAGVCSNMVTIDSAVCDPATDTYTITYTVTGNADATTYMSDQGDAAGTAYGTPVTVSGVPAVAGGMWTINVTDDGDTDCTATASTAIDPCSVAPTCSISVEVTSSCDNLGDEDETNDVTTFTVTVTGTGTGATFNASTAEDGGATTGLMYGTAYTYTITGTGGITVTFTDVDDADCTETVIMGSSCTEPDIPTLSQWGLMILALLMMTFGALRIGSVSLSTARKN